MNIGIYFGTTTGNTETCAEMIGEHFGESVGEPIDVATVKTKDLIQHDVLILGVPTWNIGDIQDDWFDKLEEIEEVDFSGKKVAFFGLGDAAGYPDSFVDALGILWKPFQKQGAEIVGLWSTEDYDFEESEGLYDENHFYGLVLDEDGEPEKTPDRIEKWVDQLKEELNLVAN
ncbi:MAG: flavodoxin [Pirellulaceae bacterium]|nr:flavodoxin [Pirellulaceae bacterium]